MRYYTHYNGSRVFRVEVFKDNLEVFSEGNEMKGRKIIYFSRFDEIFIPVDVHEYFEGNTILIRLGDTYTFIGHEIFSFTTSLGDRITNYFSPIGKNNIPAAYAVTSKGRYIMSRKSYHPFETHHRLELEMQVSEIHFLNLESGDDHCSGCVIA